jgi:hypothetical protein
MLRFLKSKLLKYVQSVHSELQNPSTKLPCIPVSQKGSESEANISYPETAEWFYIFGFVARQIIVVKKGSNELYICSGINLSSVSQPI